MITRLTATIRPITRLTGRMGVAFLAAPTGDATATPDKILAPETAYIATGKVVGTCTFDADTSDATAAEGDIRTGTSAYVNGAKLDGSLTPLDTSSATATASDILTGKTAYISDGTEATGTCDFDADTSSGDAVAADIAAGKVAWVDGEEVTGTSTFDADTSDADATAADILDTKTAYVAGAKVTGTLTVGDLVDDGYIIKSFAYDMPYEVDYYSANGVIRKQAFNGYSTSYGPFNKMVILSLKNGINQINTEAFRNATSVTTINGLENITVLNSGVRYFDNCLALQTIALPKIASVAGDLAFTNCTALTSVQFGSIGYPISLLSYRIFLSCTQLGLTITIYVTPGAQPLASSPWGATNATIVYRSAVDGSVL